jgi:uncharacterized protein (TIGR03066 family)
MRKPLGLLLLCVAACSCGGPSRTESGGLLGTWEVVRAEPPKITETFSEGGKIKVVMEMAGTGVTLNGTYKTEGDNLSVEITSNELQGLGRNDESPLGPEMAVSAKTANTGRIDWKSDDQFDIVTPKGVSTLVRVKAPSK